MQRRRFQIHLSTLIILVPLLSVLIYIGVFKGTVDEYEIRESQNSAEIVYTNTEISFGFPFHALRENSGIRNGEGYRTYMYRHTLTDFGPWPKGFYYACVVANVLVCLVITAACGFALEVLIRRREAKSQ